MYLSNHHVLSSTDIDELRDELGKLFTPHQLDITKRNHRIDSRVCSCAVNQLFLSSFAYGEDSPIQAAVNDWQCSDVISVNFPMTGAGRLTQQRQSVDISAQQGLVIDMSKPFNLDLQGYGGAALVFSHDTLRRHARSLLGNKAGDAPLQLGNCIELAKPAGRALQQAFEYAANTMNNALGALNNPISLANLESYLLTQFISLHPNSLLQHAETAPDPAVMPRHLKRARDYIHAHAHEKITLEELASYAGCSYRSLQSIFATATGMSPMEYLRGVRLAGVHDDLLQADSQHTTVAAIAQQWGFTHMGRLAGIYKKQFGVSPSDTLYRKYPGKTTQKQL